MRARAARRVHHPSRGPEGRGGPRGARRCGRRRPPAHTRGARRRARRRALAAPARGDHRRRRGRRGRGVLPRRHPRRRPLRGARPDRRPLRLAVDRVTRAAHHGRPRRAVLPSRHPPDLRHAAGGARPLRPRAPGGRRDGGGAGQPVHLPDGAGAPPLLLVAPVRDALARAPLRVLHAAGAAGGADGLPWEVTVDAWIAACPCASRSRTTSCIPWITATIGCTRDAALRASARSILQTFALAFPADLFAPPRRTTRDRPPGQPAAHARPRPCRAGPCRHARAGAAAGRAGWFLRTPAGRRGAVPLGRAQRAPARRARAAAPAARVRRRHAGCSTRTSTSTRAS